jgi:CMP-N-acetylneuraminic acid synthetase
MTGPVTRRAFIVIPARGGSKRLPGKNLVLLGGRPLLEYTVQAAVEAQSAGLVVVSTDSDEIAAAARRCGVRVVIRPAALATDAAATIDVARHALLALESTDGSDDSPVVLLQPTSPFRAATHIDEAVNLFYTLGCDTVTSVREVVDHPYWMWQPDGTDISPMFDREKIEMPRTALPPLFIENGAIYVTRRGLVRQGILYGARVAPYVMNAADSLDIDDELDLRWGEYLLGAGMSR